MLPSHVLRAFTKFWDSCSRFKLITWRVLPLVSLSCLTLLLVFSMISGTTNAAPLQFSRLWGQSGELWKSKGRLPDFSRAGYHKGDDPIPTPPVKWNVRKDFGAKGDGSTNDTAAFKKAIAKGGVIFIPEGRYKITRRLNLKSNTVLRGAGQTKTVLFFPQHLTDAEGKSERKTSTGKPVSRYSFTGGFLSADGNFKEVGIENLTIEFPKTKYRGHHRELGYNGIYFTGVRHSWVRNVTIRDFDYGVNFHRGTSFCTAIGIRLTGRGGHHGLNLTDSHHNLMTDFKIENKSIHDITVSSNANHNVVSNGVGVDINFDHHGNNPHKNLFSNIDVGKGTRPWKSSGSGKSFSGPSETFWNIQKSNGSRLSTAPGFSYSGRGKLASKINMIGATTFEQINKKKDEWIEKIDPNKLFPQELHFAQLSRRLGTTLPVNMAPVAIIANLKRKFFEGDTIILDGTDSEDADGDLLTYSWDLDDGNSTATTATVSHVYRDPGTYTVTLTVSDGKLSDTATATIMISPIDGNNHMVLPAQSVSASAWQEPNVPARTLDGKLGTRWSANGDGEWIEYDLGSNTMVDQVAIAWFRGNLRTSSFAIEVSTTGTNWTEVYNGNSNGKTLALQAYAFPAVSARYVRIVGYGNPSNKWNSITEVEISGTTNTVLPVPVQSVSASAWQEPNVPARTLDGKLGTRWSANGDGEWIEYDLGSDTMVNEVAIAWFRGDRRPSSFAIAVSMNGTDWTEVYTGNSSGKTLELQAYPFPAVLARYVRIVGFGNPANKWNSVTEVEISGPGT